MFKNEEDIKAKIVESHRRGVCDSNGRSVRAVDGRLIAKPTSFSSAAKTFVYRKGKLVSKNG